MVIPPTVLQVLPLKINSVYGTSRLASIFRLESFVHLLYCL